MKDGKYHLVEKGLVEKGFPYIALRRGEKGSILRAEPGMEMVGVTTKEDHYNLSMELFLYGTDKDLKEVSSLPDLPLEELREISEILKRYEKALASLPRG
jgi:hypothetical protein